MSTILDQIVAAKREEIARAKVAVPLERLKDALADAPPIRDFFAALAAPARAVTEIIPTRRASEDRSVRLIAEVKKASPSQGIIRADFDPVQIARTYQAAGASCLSVLTDEKYFQGSLDHLRQIRAAIEIPILRKDFILDSYQLFEARAAGADAVLLIAECLDDCHLRKLHNEAIELGMTPLVEFYDPENLPRVLEAGAQLIGVNNRDLRSFQVDLGHTIRLRDKIPLDSVLVAESGIHTRADVLRLQAAGVDAMLVGESMMRQPDIAAAVRRLLGSLTSDLRLPTSDLGASHARHDG
ncbi:MAG: indole-3-glycerol phosphate synthase TrpC [Planctomycetaceae bacterium]|nr:indole-3-glycerol phosphate synthase TrpC [Planctomycetaceae bacterium]